MFDARFVPHHMRGLTLEKHPHGPSASHLLQPQPGNLRHGKEALDDVSTGRPRVEWVSNVACHRVKTIGESGGISTLVEKAG
jgi:hypothetical protein